MSILAMLRRARLIDAGYSRLHSGHYAEARELFAKALAIRTGEREALLCASAGVVDDVPRRIDWRKA